MVLATRGDILGFFPAILPPSVKDKGEDKWHAS
jgi:hypothetical protein